MRTETIEVNGQSFRILITDQASPSIVYEVLGAEVEIDHRDAVLVIRARPVLEVGAARPLEMEEEG